MRIFANMLAYNSLEMIRGGLENFEKTTTDLEHRRLVKTVFNPGFPGNSEVAVKALASEFGWWFANIPNEGVMGNHNRVIHEYCHMEKGDYYICADPDVRWDKAGWVTESIEVLESDPDFVFVCAARPFYDEEWLIEGHGRSVHTLPSGTRYAKFKQLVAWSTGIFKGEFLASRPRDFKAVNKWYGWSEHADVDRMYKLGKKWVSLVDHYDHHLGADPVYCKWKTAQAKGESTESFDEWLKKEHA